MKKEVKAEKTFFWTSVSMNVFHHHKGKNVSVKNGRFLLKHPVYYCIIDLVYTKRICEEKVGNKHNRDRKWKKDKGLKERLSVSC